MVVPTVNSGAWAGRTPAWILGLRHCSHSQSTDQQFVHSQTSCHDRAYQDAKDSSILRSYFNRKEIEIKHGTSESECFPAEMGKLT